MFFGGIGSVLPFVALWLDSLGVSGAQSGALLATPPLLVVVFNTLIGRWADHLSDWRKAILICNGLVLALSVGLLFSQQYYVVFVLWALSGLFLMASNPIIDAAALQLTLSRGSDYAKVRSFGSIGFVVGIVAAGKFFETVGLTGFVWVVVTAALLRILAAYQLPQFKRSDSIPPAVVNEPILPIRNELSHPTPIDASVPSPKVEWFSGLKAGFEVFKQPGIFTVIVGAALLNASHSFYNIYSVLHWTQIGISATAASLLWSIGVIAEVLLMWAFAGISKRVSARHCLLFAGVICVVRWLATGLDPSLGLLVFLQLLHAITFGLTFLAGVNFIARRVEVNHAAQAQSVLATLVTLNMAIGTAVSGYFYDALAGRGYWLMSVVAIVGVGCVMLSYRTALNDQAVKP